VCLSCQNPTIFSFAYLLDEIFQSRTIQFICCLLNRVLNMKIHTNVSIQCRFLSQNWTYKHILLFLSTSFFKSQSTSVLKPRATAWNYLYTSQDTNWKSENPKDKSENSKSQEASSQNNKTLQMKLPSPLTWPPGNFKSSFRVLPYGELHFSVFDVFLSTWTIFWSYSIFFGCQFKWRI
jgi:hypothetical protein